MDGDASGGTYRRTEMAIEWLARATAIAGGLVLVFLIAMTGVSIIGRSLIWAGFGPVPGDFELVEAGTAFAIFAFLPWCHLNRGHATVEILTPVFGNRLNRWFDVIWNLVMLLAMLLITWRHWLGTADKMSNGESTFILQMPAWWGYMAAFIAASVYVLICAFCLVRSLRELRDNRHIDVMGAVH
jgi:TRAP-type C4-dicarboxylate transport system permease small subunit